MTTLIRKELLLNHPFRNKGGENSVTQSENFSNAIWLKNGLTVTSKAVVSPYRRQLADVIFETSANSTHSMIQNTYPFISGTSYTYSVFVKAGTTSRGFVQLPSSGNAFGSSQFANFDIINGYVSYSIGVTPYIIPYKNNWFRIAITAIATTTSNTTKFPLFIIRNGLDTRAPSFVGDSNNSIQLFGAQLNVGQIKPYQITTNNAV